MRPLVSLALGGLFGLLVGAILGFTTMFLIATVIQHFSSPPDLNQDGSNGAAFFLIFAWPGTFVGAVGGCVYGIRLVRYFSHRERAEVTPQDASDVNEGS